MNSTNQGPRTGPVTRTLPAPTEVRAAKADSISPGVASKNRGPVVRAKTPLSKVSVNVPLVAPLVVID